jgi:hypothetical protein
LGALILKFASDAAHGSYSLPRSGVRLK